MYTKTTNSYGERELIQFIYTFALMFLNSVIEQASMLCVEGLWSFWFKAMTLALCWVISGFYRYHLWLITEGSFPLSQSAWFAVVNFAECIHEPAHSIIYLHNWSLRFSQTRQGRSPSLLCQESFCRGFCTVVHIGQSDKQKRTQNQTFDTYLKGFCS